MRIRYALPCAIALVRASLAHGQSIIPVNRFLTLLEQQDFNRLHTEAQAVREGPCGKHYVVDYFIARSLCGSPGLEGSGREWFDYLLDHYAIPKELMGSFRADRTACTAGGNAAAGLAFDPRYLRLEIDPSSVRGKLGPLGDCFGTKKKPMHPDQPRLTEQLNDLKSNLIPVQRADTAEGMRVLRGALGKKYRIALHDPFILVAPKGLKDKLLEDQVADELRRAAEYYVSAFGFELPPYYIIAGLMHDTKTLAELSKACHGFALPKEYFGYSHTGDMTLFTRSIMGSVATARHELFHLLARTNSGDLPPWLDEGVASVLEASEWKDGALKGKLKYGYNYRLEALQQAGHLREISRSIPRIDALVDMGWERFEGLDEDPECILALHYAVAKHFALFLQEEGRLADVLRAHQHLVTTDAEGRTRFRTSRQVTEEALGAPLSVVGRRYEQWFKETYGFDPYQPF